MRAMVAIGLGAAVLGASIAGMKYFHATPQAVALAPASRTGSADVTSREGLARTIRALAARVAANNADEQAAVALADALMRQARVTGDGSLAKQAEAALSSAIAATDGYAARRMLGAVYLSQHRFLEAFESGRAASSVNPSDAWNYGVIGDAAIELGQYDEAFAAFDRMAAVKPSAAAYARIAYARELQGDLDGALSAMRMAAEATSPQDPEGLAWSWSQIGALHLQRGEIDAASSAYDRALLAFPHHPYALTGRGRVAVARGDLDAALSIYRQLLVSAPTPELSAQVGDLLDRRGAGEDARAAWANAERLEREGWQFEAPQYAALARLLADRDQRPREALAFARQAAQQRDDIFTNDTLAWALYRNRRLDDAWQASLRARRTGTRDRRVLYHAAAIAAARGDRQTARTLASQALEGLPNFDLIAAPAAQALLAQLN